MKNILILFTLFSGMVISCQTKKENSAGGPVVSGSSAIVEVYNFHSTYRCATCLSIEMNTRKTLSQYFVDELNNGTVTLQVVNIDLPENAAFAEQFQAYGTSLFLRVNKNGRPQIIDLSEFAFMKARNAEAFQTQLKSRIISYL